MAFNSSSKESLALVCLVQDGGRWLIAGARRAMQIQTAYFGVLQFSRMATLFVRRNLFEVS